MAEARTRAAEELARRWATDPRWRGAERTHTAEDVVRLSGTVREEHTLARRGAERLWRQLHERDYVHALGALTGGQAVQQVKAGLQAIYLSGWQVAADANQAGHTYPDQSLYPANSVPQVVRRINNALLRAADIDAGMELGCAHPMGPLKLADLIGLDTLASIAGSLYDEFKEPLYAPPPLLQRMVEARLLGRKTGRGFPGYGQG
ncbi:3-hydroxyacyl-CoA dehydrogenase family protein [Streptomyces cucumeris]|uniref:3-hydroxyacyl-CoA dehydrogenase family protein n=1 Tax=Streptomyces cucumeris TaxID=2962890 RepID=UPI003D7486A7